MSPGTAFLILLPLGLLAGGMRHPWAGTAGCALVWSLAWRQGSVPPGKSAGLWASFLVWLGLSAMASDQPLKGLYPLSLWLAVSAFFFTARGLWEERERSLWLWTLCGSSLVLMAGSLLIQRVSYPWTGFMPPYYNYNAFVMAGAFGAGLGALCAGAGPAGDPAPGEVPGACAGPAGVSREQRGALMGVMGLAVLWLLAARSRGGLAAAAAAAAVWLVRTGRLSSRPRPRPLTPTPLLRAAGTLGLRPGSRALLWCGAAVLAGGLLVPRAGWDAVLKRDRSNAFKRPQIWAASAAMASEHPLLGVGLGNYERGFVPHAFPSGLGTNFGFFSDRAHCEPLHLAAEAGWAGLALLLAALWALMQERRREAGPGDGAPRAGPWDVPLAVSGEAGLGAFTAMSAHLLVDNMLHIPALAFLYFSALAVALPRLVQVPAAPPAAQADPRPWRVACSLGLALCLVAWMPGRFADVWRDRAWSDPDPGKRVAAARAAAAVFPADDHLVSVLARAYLRAVPPGLESALREFKRARELNAFNALHPAMAAEVLLMSGRPGAALPLLDEAVRLEPNFHNARLLAAEIRARSGEPALAVRELAEIRRRRELLKGADAHGRYDEMVLGLDEGRLAALTEALARRSARR